MPRSQEVDIGKIKDEIINNTQLFVSDENVDETVDLCNVKFICGQEDIIDVLRKFLTAST